MSNNIEMTPGIIKNNEGEYMAPKTFSDLVYMNNGDTLDNVIEDIYAIDRSCVIETKTYSFKVDVDGQRAFPEIPMPYEKYDLEKHVMFMLDSNKELIDSAKYEFDTINAVIQFNDENLYNTFKANDIFYLVYVYADNVITGGKYSVSSVKRSVEIIEECSEVSIGIDMAKGKDTLLVYKNSVYIEEGIDYDVTSDAKTIKLRNDDVFKPGDTINFVLISNTNGKVVSLKRTVIIESEKLRVNNISKVDISIYQYSRSSDTLFVFMNGTYLEVNQDYYISDDSKYIMSIGAPFQLTTESVRFDFIVLKNVLDYNTVNSIFVSDVYDNLLDDSTGFFNTWELDPSSINSKLGITPYGASDYSNAIVINNNGTSTSDEGIVTKSLSGTFNHKQFITIQAKIKFDKDFTGSVNMKVHEVGSRELFNDNFVINVEATDDNKDKWLDVSATGQVLLIDDLVYLKPVELKTIINVKGKGIVNISEIKVAKAKKTSAWRASDQDINYVMKIVSALSL